MSGDDIRTIQVEGIQPISPQLDLANEILNQWLNYALYRSTVEESNLATQIFQLTGSYDWEIREFGYEIDQGNIANAESILSTLPTSDTNQQIFYETQLLNLKRIEIEDSLTNNYNFFYEDSLRALYFNEDSAVANGRPYFTEGEVQSVKSMAETETSSAAYARTLYYLLTGDHIDIPGIESGDTQSELLMESNNLMNESVDIYPNPVSEVLFITRDESISNLSIFGLNGKLIQQMHPNKSKVTVRTNALLPGIYFLQIQTKSGKTMHKIIKQ